MIVNIIAYGSVVLFTIGITAIGIYYYAKDEEWESLRTTPHWYEKKVVRCYPVEK